MGLFVGGVLIAIIGVLVFYLFAHGENRDEVKKKIIEIFEQPIEIPDVNESHETESSLRRKQLEKLAKEKPENLQNCYELGLAED